VGKLEQVSACYGHAENVTFWPTLSNEMRTSEDGVNSYFDGEDSNSGFLSKLDRNHDIVWNRAEGHNLGENLVLWSGSYTFGLADNAKVTARFSYLVKKIDDDWKILHHHSSQMPE